MWLTLDLGNSKLKGGLFRGDEITRTFTVSYGTENTSLQQQYAFAEELQAQLDGAEIDGVALCSVVPLATTAVKEALPHLSILEVSPRTNLPFPLAYESPETLGADRLAAAVGGWEQYASPRSASSAIIVDAGTAITIDVVTSSEGYLGGVIAPGPQLMAESLHSGTVQLPLVSHQSRPRVIGKTTTEAMESGVIHGAASMVEGLLQVVTDDLEGGSVVTVLTGGWCHRLSSCLSTDHETDKHLVLRGLRALIRRSSFVGTGRT